MEELAARQGTIKPSSGVLFARNVDGEQKSAARQRVLELFTLPQWPGHLHMLTMPGVQWRFERKLLAMRHPGWTRSPSPWRTYFTSTENDRAIFFAAVAEMPGLHTPQSSLKRIKNYPFAEMGVRTRFASLFFANIDDLMAQTSWSEGWHAVWLDYSGPLSVERLAIIRQFYRDYIKGILIITALKGRWNQATNQAIHQAGGYSNWLRNTFDGELLHDLEYFDTSPMVQFAVQKRSALWFWQ